MASSDVPATALGVTDPRGWDRTSWLADLLPHLVYGVATAITFDALADQLPGSSSTFIQPAWWRSKER
jgi:hypothetical protein